MTSIKASLFVGWRLALERRDPTNPYPNVRPQHFSAATIFGVGTPIWGTEVTEDYQFRNV